MASTRKVVLFIVEGPSDEAAYSLEQCPNPHLVLEGWGESGRKQKNTPWFRLNQRRRGFQQHE